MSCPLLDKLAPEIRTHIYEYVLSFATPLRHENRMKPFLEKMLSPTDAQPKPEVDGTPGASHLSDAPKDDAKSRSSSRRIDTAILLANKLVFTEAIEVFYNMNTIHVEEELCQLAKSHTVQTDLSLAKHVMVTTHARKKGEGSPNSRASNLTSLTAFTGLSAVSPKICTATIYVVVDEAENPTIMLFDCKSTFDNMPSFDNCKFDGVGSLVALVHGDPKFKLVVQYKAMMQHWADCATDAIPQEPMQLDATSANALSRFVAANPQSTYTTITHVLFAAQIILHLSRAYPAVEPNSLAVEPNSLAF